MIRSSAAAALLVVLCGAATVAGGCGLILGLDQFTDETAGAGGRGGGATATTGSASGGAGGVGGADPACDDVSECPAPEGDCSTALCADHRCGFSAVANGIPVAAQVVGDCQEVQCDGAGATKVVPKSDDVEDDENACTIDACSASGPSHAFVAAREPCADGGGVMCDGAGHCVACTAPGDCASGVCQGGLCVDGSCVDGTKNGDETDQDCGGSCAPCPDGGDCLSGADCTGGACDPSGSCCTPTTCAVLGLTCGAAPDGCGGTLQCDDGAKNGTETDVDCGGPSCKTCDQGGQCSTAPDCVTGHCVDGYCCDTSCTASCYECGYPGDEGFCSVAIDHGDAACPPDAGGPRACGPAATCLGGHGHPCTVAGQCASGCCRLSKCQAESMCP